MSSYYGTGKSVTQNSVQEALSREEEVDDSRDDDGSDSFVSNGKASMCCDEKHDNEQDKTPRSRNKPQRDAKRVLKESRKLPQGRFSTKSERFSCI